MLQHFHFFSLWNYLYLYEDDFEEKENEKVETKVSTQNENINDNKEIENLRNENQNLRKENDLLNKINQKLRKENENLTKKLAELNLIKDQEIKQIEEKYKILINKLKSKLSSNVVESKNYVILLDWKKLVALNFISVDQCINHTIICKNKTKFHEAEGQLYEKFPEYVDDRNFFMFNENRINSWGTIEDNGIHGYTIMLKKIED